MAWTDRDRLVDAFYRRLGQDDDFLREYIVLLDLLDEQLGPLTADTKIHQVVRKVTAQQPGHLSEGVRKRILAAHQLAEASPALAKAELRELTTRVEAFGCCECARKAVHSFAGRWHLPAEGGVEALLRCWRIWRDSAIVDRPVSVNVGSFSIGTIPTPALPTHSWSSAHTSKRAAKAALKEAEDADIAAVKVHYSQLRSRVDEVITERYMQTIDDAAREFLAHYHPVRPESTNDLARKRAGRPADSADAVRNSPGRKQVERRLNTFREVVRPLGLMGSDIDP